MLKSDDSNNYSATDVPPQRMLSTVFTKCLMALTGVAWGLFILAHLAGNLLLFKGAEDYNKYSEFLEKNPLTIPAEVVLVVLFLLHVYASIKVTWENWAARPQGYAMKRRMGESTFASRTMIYTGTLILGFVVLHIWMFKYGAKYTPEHKIALWQLVTTEFQKPWVMGVYVAAMAVLGFHLSHALTSWLQSLGFLNARWRGLIRKPGMVAGWAIALVFMSMPLWAFTAQPQMHKTLDIPGTPVILLPGTQGDASVDVPNQKPETRN